MSTKLKIRIEHGVMVFRNFAGAKKMYNDAGKRNFCVYLDGYDRRGNEFENPDDIPQYKYGPDWMSPNDLIPALERDGWIVKWTKPSEDGERQARPYIKVNVQYSEDYPRFNPKVYVTRADGGLNPIDEETLSLIDTVWVQNADLIIKPFNYEERSGIENGKVSAQLDKLYVTPVEDVDEDDFDGKYAAHEEAPF